MGSQENHLLVLSVYETFSSSSPFISSLPCFVDTTRSWVESHLGDLSSPMLRRPSGEEEGEVRGKEYFSILPLTSALSQFRRQGDKKELRSCM